MFPDDWPAGRDSEGCAWIRADPARPSIIKLAHTIVFFPCIVNDFSLYISWPRRRSSARPIACWWAASNVLRAVSASICFFSTMAQRPSRSAYSVINSGSSGYLARRSSHSCHAAASWQYVSASAAQREGGHKE